MKLKKLRLQIDEILRRIDVRIYWIGSLYRIGRMRGLTKFQAFIAAIRSK